MPDTSPIAYIRRVLSLAEQGEIDTPETSAFLTTWLRTWIAGTEAGCRSRISMETAAGLGAPGRPNWTKQEKREQRDFTLRELRRRHAPDLSPRAAARALLALSPRPVDMPDERQLANILRK